MYYYFDLQLVHAFIFIIPCLLISLFKLWTKLVAKSQVQIKKYIFIFIFAFAHINYSFIIFLSCTFWNLPGSGIMWGFTEKYGTEVLTFFMKLTLRDIANIERQTIFSKYFVFCYFPICHFSLQMVFRGFLLLAHFQ